MKRFNEGEERWLVGPHSKASERRLRETGERDREKEREHERERERQRPEREKG